MTNIIQKIELLLANEEIAISLKLLIALFFGAIVGMERKHVKRNPAILRTNIFICVGSTLVTVAGIWLSENYGGDPARIAAQVIGSIGFLGIGMMFRQGNNLSGLTTAASLWVTGCIGVAIGVGAYVLAIVGAVIVLATLIIVRDKPDNKHQKIDEDEENKY